MFKKKYVNHVAWVSTVIAVIVILVLLLVRANNAPGKYDQFAQCLKESGTVFYGAFWCPHCQNQKAMFGKSAKYLPYVECSNPDKSMTQSCQAKSDVIEGYPTWTFPDGSVQSGEISFEELAAKSQCTLPV